MMNTFSWLNDYSSTIQNEIKMFTRVKIKRCKYTNIRGDAARHVDFSKKERGNISLSIF